MGTSWYDCGNGEVITSQKFAKIGRKNRFPAYFSIYRRPICNISTPFDSEMNALHSCWLTDMIMATLIGQNRENALTCILRHTREGPWEVEKSISSYPAQKLKLNRPIWRLFRNEILWRSAGTTARLYRVPFLAGSYTDAPPTCHRAPELTIVHVMLSGPNRAHFLQNSTLHTIEPSPATYGVTNSR